MHSNEFSLTFRSQHRLNLNGVVLQAIILMVDLNKFHIKRTHNETIFVITD